LKPRSTDSAMPLALPGATFSKILPFPKSALPEYAASPQIARLSCKRQKLIGLLDGGRAGVTLTEPGWPVGPTMVDGVTDATAICWSFDSTFTVGKFVPVQPAVAVADTTRVGGAALTNAITGWIVGGIYTELRAKLTAERAA